MIRSSHEIGLIDFTTELNFKAVKSSGPGGQNVNKVNTKVFLLFEVQNSELLYEEEKQVILNKLSPYINADGMLQISVQETRSQLKNKEIAIVKLHTLIQGVFVRKKVRKATKPKKSAVMKRLDSKKKHAEKKQWRKKL
ncbi:aminoacyl-tRNA hydrolase [Echinicola sp. CAU 1574]|uniref:Aminoacyl-tRNA hydrolase n=1 Tax=Echinicola arenosa TaxID=2774144 RepID=A0ABR9AST4_9BACT|nr:alternative ribosome rescue aminoacyl-tRNA hydrolase ArfB [Echinicola arenosa]MBD8490669.1 aminoacyl-tRNA hydrolase [Echinicola arenosa]